MSLRFHLQSLSSDSPVGPLAVPASRISFLGLDELGAPCLTSRPFPSPGSFVALAPLAFESLHFLALLAPAGAGVRINGAPAPPFAVLREQDVVSLGEAVFLLAVSLHAYVGPPLPEHVGRECPVCLTPIRSPEAGVASVVYACPHCDAVLHERASIDGEPVPLECSSLGSACPICKHPLIRRSEHALLPDDCA